MFGLIPQNESSEQFFQGLVKPQFRRFMSKYKFSFVTHFEDSKTEKMISFQDLPSYNETRDPILVRYDLARAKAFLNSHGFDGKGLWRYHALLPLQNPANVISMGEGQTPLFEVARLANACGLKSLLIKDESINPTASFKARGASVAISMAKERGLTKLAIPSAGNAATSAAAYAARAGIDLHVVVPSDTPEAFIQGCLAVGAGMQMIDGNIADAGRYILEHSKSEGWQSIATFREPFRLEGKKTMGFEIAEQTNFDLPDAIIYPTGGGIGVVAIWKAFMELKEIGMLAGTLPRMVCVQTDGCAPIVEAFQNQREQVLPWKDPKTMASGLRVPQTMGDRLLLRVLKESHGTAISVSEEAMIYGLKLIATQEGIFPAPEGGAGIAAIRLLLERKLIDRKERILLLNTGSGYKYVDVLRKYFPTPFHKEISPAA